MDYAHGTRRDVNHKWNYQGAVPWFWSGRKANRRDGIPGGRQ